MHAFSYFKTVQAYCIVVIIPYQHAISDHYRPASETFRWWSDDGPPFLCPSPYPFHPSIAYGALSVSRYMYFFSKNDIDLSDNFSCNHRSKYLNRQAEIDPEMTITDHRPTPRYREEATHATNSHMTAAL